MESGNVDELTDPSLEHKYDINQMDRLILTASYCVRQSSIWRPSMAEVHLFSQIRLMTERVFKVTLLNILIHSYINGSFSLNTC